MCRTIIPPDDRSGGAIEAVAPEFIDLLSSENSDYQRRLGRGLHWLDATYSDWYGKVYIECSPEQRKEILELIAYRRNAKKDPSLSRALSSFLRDLTVDGFYNSEIGIEDLQYIGNDYLPEFPGCPSLPDA